MPRPRYETELSRLPENSNPTNMDTHLFNARKPSTRRRLNAGRKITGRGRHHEALFFKGTAHEVIFPLPPVTTPTGSIGDPAFLLHSKRLHVERNCTTSA